MLKNLARLNAGLFRRPLARSFHGVDQTVPKVIFVHVRSSIQGTYYDDAKIREKMITYATHYTNMHGFTDIQTSKLEVSQEYCAKHELEYENFMQAEAGHIVEAIDKAAYFAAEHANTDNDDGGFENTIVQVQWPEHSFLVGGGVGPEGGAIPEHIFQQHILEPLSKKIVSWPAHIHMDASSLLVSVIDRSKTLFQKQLKDHLFFGGYGNDRPYIFNTSLFLEAGKPITLTTKHTISITNKIIGLRTDDLSRDNRLDYDQINSENTQVRKSPMGNDFVVVQALCLDADPKHAIPFRSAMNWSYEENDFQKLKECKGYTIISSDTIVFQNFDGMTHLLFSQADSNPDESAVVLLDHLDERDKSFDSVTINLPGDSNPYAVKSFNCFPPVEMQNIRQSLKEDLESMEKIVSDQGDDGKNAPGL